MDKVHWVLLIAALTGWFAFFGCWVHYRRAARHTAIVEAENERLRKYAVIQTAEMAKQNDRDRAVHELWESVPREIRSEIVSTRAKAKVQSEIVVAAERRKKSGNVDPK